MARSFVTASSQRLTVASAVATAKPITFTGWANISSSVLTESTVLGLSINAGGVHNGLGLSLSGDASIAMFQFIGGAFEGIFPTTPIPLDQWFQFAAVFASSGNSLMYINGSLTTGGSVAISNSNPAGMNTTTIGGYAFPDGTTTNLTQGLLADFAIYSAALSVQDINQLALERLTPLLVNASQLVAYWPLIGRSSPEIEIANSAHATLVNTPTTAVSPPLVRPKRRMATYFYTSPAISPNYAKFPKLILRDNRTITI